MVVLIPLGSAFLLLQTILAVTYLRRARARARAPAATSSDVEHGVVVAPKATPAHELADAGPLSASEIQSRQSGSKVAASYALSDGFTLRYAALSQRGYYPHDLYKANQDCYILAPYLGDAAGVCLLGVFDGHGPDGHEASRFVRDGIVAEVTRQLESIGSNGFGPSVDASIQDALTRSTRIINSHMLLQVG